MRVHLVSAVLVGLVGSGIALGLAEKVTLIFCVLLIFFAEILNSALEHLVDLGRPAVRREGPPGQGRGRRGRHGAGAGHRRHLRRAAGAQLGDVVRNSGPQIARQVALGLPLTACVTLLVLPRPPPARLGGRGRLRHRAWC